MIKITKAPKGDLLFYKSATFFWKKSLNFDFVSMLSIIRNTAFLQSFSGYWPEFGGKGYKYGYVFSAENRMVSGQNGAYHQSLNRAFNFVRKDGLSCGIYSEAWFQRLIHKYISHDGTYIYNNKGYINGTLGQ